MKNTITIIALIIGLTLAGCTTLTTTAKDGTVTKTTAPVVSLWEKVFDFGTTLYNDTKKTAVVAAPKKGE